MRQLLFLAAVLILCCAGFVLLYNWQENDCKHNGGTFITVGGRPGCVYLPKEDKTP